MIHPITTTAVNRQPSPFNKAAAFTFLRAERNVVDRSFYEGDTCEQWRALFCFKTFICPCGLQFADSFLCA
jgi:hypothetical protein